MATQLVPNWQQATWRRGREEGDRCGVLPEAGRGRGRCRQDEDVRRGLGRGKGRSHRDPGVSGGEVGRLQDPGEVRRGAGGGQLWEVAWGGRACRS